MSFGYILRFRRLRMVSQENLNNNQNHNDMTTQDYIQQAEEIMGKK